MDLFYIVGILDERAHNTIGDAFFTFLVLFFGAFDCVLVYLNELFLDKKDTLHMASAAFRTTTRPTLHLGVSLVQSSRTRKRGLIAHTHTHTVCVGSWDSECA